MKELEFFESRRKTRPLIEYDLGNRVIYLQAFDGFTRACFTDMLADLKEEGAGQMETTWRIAVFACAHGIVDKLGNKVFESPEHALKVFSEWEDRGEVFEIAQRLLDESGLSKKAEDTAAKN